MLHLLFSMLAGVSHGDEAITILCLGDSYTIGQSVIVEDRFPEQTIEILNGAGIHFEAPVVVARTGWTTENLIDAVAKKEFQQTFDYVTLLIGVNDQFQGKSIAAYETNFSVILQTAIELAGGKPDHVFVLSIPDYGVTPFAEYGRHSPEQISSEIDVFNTVNKKIAAQAQVKYIDITTISRDAKDDDSLLAADGLHPSGKMYAAWAALLAKAIRESK